MMTPKWETTGIVDCFDLDNGTITFWLGDFDDLQTVPITREMPAWLFGEEVYFRAKILRSCVRSARIGGKLYGPIIDFEFRDSSMSSAELFGRLVGSLKKKEPGESQSHVDNAENP